MAEFTGFGQSVTNMLKQCANNNDRNDIASFLIMQQNFIQAKYNEQRMENKKKEAENNTANKPSTPGSNNAANSAKNNAGSAFARMKALANAKK